LLKIEKELSDAIHSAKVVWLRAPRPQQLSLFPKLERERGEQLTLFDLSGITDEEFWDKVHGRVRDGLADYIRETANGASIQRRLFAEDTLQGLAFFDLSRTQFDVVVMNPPFGDFSKSFATQARALFPQSYNDIFGAFVERSLDSLQPGGFLGAITSRAGFFLGSFANWREKVVLEKGTLRCLADLGNRVMDDATVEAAAYCLEKCNAVGARLTLTVIVTLVGAVAIASTTATGPPRARILFLRGGFGGDLLAIEIHAQLRRFELEV